MINVIKRDGEIAEFSLCKITEAIKKAFKATGMDYSNEILELLALRVTADFQNKMMDGSISVEQIQDSVEHVLEHTGYTEVAKAYILYRRQREKVRNMKNTILNYKDVVNNYVSEADVQSRDPSAATYSVGGLILSNSGAVMANYWLTEVYDSEVAEAHRSGDIHIHDLTMLTGCSAGWSLRQLLTDGLTGVPGHVSSAPARHLSVFCNQMVNFLGIVQNEWAEAQSLSSFDTYLAPFVKSEGLDERQVKKCIEAFINGINIPCRWGTRAPFSNLTLDWTVPEDMAGERAIIGGKEQEFTYGDCGYEMRMINRALLQTLLEGDADGNPFYYPVVTCNLNDSFDWNETEESRMLFQLAAKNDRFYFANHIGSGIASDDVRWMRNRDYLKLGELHWKAGGTFGAGENTGSIGIVTVNLPRIAYLAQNRQEFFDRLDHMLDLAARSLKVKREVLSKLLDGGLYPYTKRYLGSFEKYFSTIGIMGINEAVCNAGWLNQGLAGVQSLQFAKEVLEHIRGRLIVYQKQYKDLFSLEEISSKVIRCRLAEIDKNQYPGIQTAKYNEEKLCYTEGSRLPADCTAGIEEQLRIQDELQLLYTSGSEFRIRNAAGQETGQTADLIREIAWNHKVPYFTVSQGILK